MAKTGKIEILELSSEEIPELIKAVQENTLSDKFKEIILTLIKQMVDIKRTSKEKAAALKRIKRMLKHSTEKLDKTKEEKKYEPKKNHGRNGVEDYKFSNVVNYPDEERKVGEVCSSCAHGTLQQMEPRKIIRLVGQPIITAELHRPERLRCSGCGEVFTAQMPEEVGGEKATASANAMVAVLRYGMGVPHYRLASMQSALGVPIPASTQYEMVEMLWTHVMPVYKELLHQAANSPLFFIDDTKATILSMIKGNEQRKADGERCGIFTTGIVAQDAGRTIRLFFTGRNHAGENIAELLSLRTDESKPMQMCDALSRNAPKDPKNPKDHLVRLLLCLVHARRNFFDCYEAFTDETTYVIEQIGLVYKNEKHTKENQMDPVQRLEYHKKHSEKIMNDIKAYSEEKIATKAVEPNSILGAAFAYFLKFWVGLTQFLRIPGAPLDNNAGERLLKTMVTHRKNSLFFKTENGAMVGDVLMSLIQTAIAANISPFEYLTVLQNNSQHVAKNPQLWLPWNFHNMLKSVAPPKTG
ncbi:MAG: IS66 family transposase [Candidatus Riflebacteria bacterium]|nr:IS66 family transposase [Candidatus Riflebacteria bacterium]